MFESCSSTSSTIENYMSCGEATKRALGLGLNPVYMHQWRKLFIRSIYLLSPYCTLKIFMNYLFYTVEFNSHYLPECYSLCTQWDGFNNESENLYYLCTMWNRSYLLCGKAVRPVQCHCYSYRTRKLHRHYDIFYVRKVRAVDHVTFVYGNIVSQLMTAPMI